jgi:hypothetical protein
MIIVGVLSTFLHLPVSLIGLAAGTLTPLPSSLSVLIGALMGKFLFSRILKEWWANNVVTITAGLAAGASIIICITTALDIILKSMLTTPF